MTNLLLPVLEAGKSPNQGASILVSSQDGEEREANFLLCFLARALILPFGLHAHGLITIQRLCLQIL